MVPQGRIAMLRKQGRLEFAEETTGDVCTATAPINESTLSHITRLRRASPYSRTPSHAEYNAIVAEGIHVTRFPSLNDGYDLRALLSELEKALGLRDAGSVFNNHSASYDSLRRWFVFILVSDVLDILLHIGIILVALFLKFIT
jgi:hypothetical protein